MSSVRQYIRNQSLYRKFALAILSLGLIPVFVIFPILAGRTVRGNVTAAELNYRQAASHANRSVETILSSYDSTTKLLYQYNGANTTDNLYYNYGRYDTIRQILTDENLQNRNSGLLLFLIIGFGLHLWKYAWILFVLVFLYYWYVIAYAKN